MRSRVDTLLEEREIRGLRVTLWARVGLVVYLGLGIFTAQSRFETIALAIICTANFALLALFFRFLRRGERLRLVGLGGVLNDSLLISIMPIVFYLSIGGTAVTPAFTLKNMVPLFAMMMICVNSLAIRPLYPLTIAGVSMLAYLGLLLYAVQDPRVEFTADLKEEFMGEKIMPALHVFKAILIFTCGAILALLTHRARDTIHEAVQLELSNARIGRYFSPGVAGRIAAADDEFLKPGGVQQNVAVLFADIRDFTAISERLSPAEVVEMLSAYHEKMVAAIFAEGGTLDKFIGDAIMATFGTPDPTPDAPLRAVRAGIGMQRALVELNRERAARGLDPLASGIGIHYGPVVAGNIGTAQRLEYTVIGDTVNTASRLESACKEVGHSFLVTAAVRDAVASDPQIRLRDLGTLEARGKREPLAIFAVEV